MPTVVLAEREEGGGPLGSVSPGVEHTHSHHDGQRIGVLQLGMDNWTYRHGVESEFIRPRRRVENSYIESFSGQIRDECLNVHPFFSL